MWNTFRQIFWGDPPNPEDYTDPWLRQRAEQLQRDRLRAIGQQEAQNLRHRLEEQRRRRRARLRPIRHLIFNNKALLKYGKILANSLQKQDKMPYRKYTKRRRVSANFLRKKSKRRRYIKKKIKRIKYKVNPINALRKALRKIYKKLGHRSDYATTIYTKIYNGGVVNSAQNKVKYSNFGVTRTEINSALTNLYYWDIATKTMVALNATTATAKDVFYNIYIKMEVTVKNVDLVPAYLSCYLCTPRMAGNTGPSALMAVNSTNTNVSAANQALWLDVFPSWINALTDNFKLKCLLKEKYLKPGDVVTVSNSGKKRVKLYDALADTTNAYQIGVWPNFEFLFRQHGALGALAAASTILETNLAYTMKTTMVIKFPAEVNSVYHYVATSLADAAGAKTSQLTVSQQINTAP